VIKATRSQIGQMDGDPEISLERFLDQSFHADDSTFAGLGLNR